MALNEVLTSFHGLSGLRANRSKSHLYFSSSVTPASKEGILHTLGMETFGGLLSLSHSVVQAQGESKRPGTRGGLLHFFILFYTNERKDALAVTPLVRSRSHPWSQARKTPAAKQRLSPRDKQVLLERIAQLQLESLEQNIILDIQLLALAPLGAW